MNCHSSNGRVNIITPNTNTLFSLQDRIPVQECSDYRDATAGQWYETKLSQAYFSGANIQYLQNNIRAGVHKASKGKYLIGEQDCDVLKTIMRGIFLQFAKNNAENISQQIQELNQKIIDYAVPQIMGEADGYLHYIKDISTLAKPMSHPIMANQNDKQLFLKSFF